MGNLFGSGNDTTQTSSTRTTSYDPWISQMQQGVSGLAAAQAMPFVGNVSPYARAGFNVDQMKGFDLARDAAQSVDEGGRTMVGGGGSLGGWGLSNMDAATSQAAHSNGAQTGAGDYSQFMSPYINSVVNPALETAHRERDNNRAAIGARAASQGAFGGSGEALQAAQNTRNSQSDTNQMVAQLMAAGYDKATAMAQANTALRQQTDLTNSGYEQQTALQNAQNEQAANSQNAQQRQAFGLSQADNQFRGLQYEDEFKGSDLDRRIASINALLGIGQFQQNDAQQTLNVPRDMLTWANSFVPQQYNVTEAGTQTEPDNSPSFLQSVLGAGASILGTQTSQFNGSVGGNLFSKLFS